MPSDQCDCNQCCPSFDGSVVRCCVCVCVSSCVCVCLCESRTLRWNNKIGLMVRVGGLCAKGGDSWRRCSCVCCCCVRVDSKTPPCADSNRLRVCRQKTPVSTCRHGRFAGTHDGNVLILHTEVFNVPHHTHHHTPHTPTHTRHHHTHTNTHQQDTDNTPTPKPTVIFVVF